MTSKEYRDLVNLTGKTNKQIAQALGVTEDSIVKRKGGRTPIRKESELAILYIVKGEINADNTDN